MNQEVTEKGVDSVMAYVGNNNMKVEVVVHMYSFKFFLKSEIVFLNESKKYLQIKLFRKEHF